MRPPGCLLERFERPRGALRSGHHHRIIGLGAAAIVARVEQIIIAAVADHPAALDQYRKAAPPGRLRNQFPGCAPRREGEHVGAEFLHLDRLETRPPVEQMLAGRRIIELHRVDVDKAGAALERATDVAERTPGASPPVATPRHSPWRSSDVSGLAEIIEDVARACPRRVRRPEILRPGRPCGLHRQRVAEIPPVRQVFRTARAGY